ncbi:neuropeptide F receptor-like [Ostrea edulis]|uniref:neuropeptide F receptor-like n=1 Tax=Ostrea edulis TaxID=37623 RepID=UPI002094EE5F|nr:neuropeptide F receptor-like [Ostrea edulis]
MNFSSEVDLFHNHFNLSFDRSDVDLSMPNLLREQSWKITFILLFAIVIFFGFFENLAIVIVIIINKQLHTVTNIFISTLALSDIMLCAFNLPFQLHYGITDFWRFGPILCRVIIPMFTMPVFVSTYAMLMIAIERYIVIVFPFRKKLTQKQAVCIVVIIMLFAMTFTIPAIVHTEVKLAEYDMRPFIDERIYRPFCLEVWEERASRIYTIFGFAFQFVIPKTLISVLYFQIYNVLKRRPVKRKETRRNYRITRILVSIAILFTITWLPFQLFSITLYFSPDIFQTLGAAYKLVDLLLKIIAMSSSCINPFFYGWLNNNFRREMATMLGRNLENVQKSSNGFTTYNHTNVHSKENNGNQGPRMEESALL